MWRRLLACLQLIFAVATPVPASDAHRELIAGAYSFSDELGGFIILAASGTGTRSDPIIVRQEFLSASPVTLVIRAVKPIRPIMGGTNFATGFIHMRLESFNNSGLAWEAFEFELQEQRDIPSVYGDGLSFDQRRSQLDNVGSDLFRHYSRDFEPFDRLLFTDGKVDPLQTVTFRFFISDFTPKRQFYLVQDPRIPSS